MFLPREYTTDDFNKLVVSDDFIILTSNIDEPRSNRLIELYPQTKRIEIDYSVDMGENNILKDSFKIQTNFDCSYDGKTYDSLYNDLRMFVKELCLPITRKLLIDISSLHLRFLGALLATISEFTWEAVFCSYTETTSYPRSREAVPFGNKSFDHKAGFDLNSSFWGYDEIPNLKTITSERDNYVWIAFLGFEGKRTSAVYTEISDDANVIIPVITTPSVKPGWANYAFEANQILFENGAMCCADIQYTDALDPFATYNFIENIEIQYPNKHLVISPLGTKPVSLGVLLYALLHEESEVYFDTPKNSCFITLNAGKVHFYDILSFIEESNKDIERI